MDLVSTKKEESTKSIKTHSNKHSQTSKPIQEVHTFHDYGFETYGLVPNEIPLDSIIIKSTLQSKNNAEQISNIVRAFNSDADVKSIVTTDALRGKRIEPGLFKVFSLNNKAILQPSTDQNIAKVLYPLSTSIVLTHGTVSQKEVFISRFGKHVLNIPTGSIAKVKIGTELYFYGEGPHFINDANLVFNPMSDIFDLNECHISHGTYHILTVPSGKIARIVIDGAPQLLPSRSSPYVFNNPRFNLEVDSRTASCFEDATSKLIINGAIKRLIVDTGEVAVISNNGQLEIIEPNETGTPIVIKNQLVRVDPHPFVSTNLQTIIFPSGQRYETAQTADGVQVKMKLMITYKIVDPKMAIRQLNSPQKILEHIEYCALTDMRNATQSCNFYAVQQTEGSRAKVKEDGSPQYYQHIQDELKMQLREELKLIGVELGRLTFEEFVIDDQKVQDQRSSNAQAIASTTAQVSNLEKERTLKIQTEETAKEVAKIQMQQQRQAQISRAQTELEKTEIQLKMDSLITDSKAQQESMKLRIQIETDLQLKKMNAELSLEVAEIEAKATIAKAKALRDAEMKTLEARGEIYEKHPHLFELELAEIHAEALSLINTTFVGTGSVSQYNSLLAQSMQTGSPFTGIASSARKI
jgi:regulator of protease activity HflC (stomatin/prohibitin superfamily)